jgi:UDP-glucuronate decarboxylase
MNGQILTKDILSEDLDYIFKNLSDPEKKKLKDSTLLITGCGGFLGYYFLHFFSRYHRELGIKKIIAVDNFITGSRSWIETLARNTPVLRLQTYDVIKQDLNEIDGADKADIIIHLASIASPTYYRIYPLETLDSNITGLRKLLDYYVNQSIKGFIFFSSSEMYGDPFPEYIPTKEDYRGNVATMGPRACYDEAKRFGETLCYIFNQKYNFPVTIARPFNNYGPGMNINDKRLPADFAKAVIEGRDLEILSDGTPTRTFCYISDAITGYIKVLLYDKLEAFNIGIDRPEISVKQFSEIFVEKGKKVFDYKGKITFQESHDEHYMTDNPNRRCPDISKAKKHLNYNPTVLVEEGIERYLTFLKATKGELI